MLDRNMICTQGVMILTVFS